jgi:hypothetical protein
LGSIHHQFGCSLQALFDTTTLNVDTRLCVIILASPVLILVEIEKLLLWKYTKTGTADILRTERDMPFIHNAKYRLVQQMD